MVKLEYSEAFALPKEITHYKRKTYPSPGMEVYVVAERHTNSCGTLYAAIDIKTGNDWNGWSSDLSKAVEDLITIYNDLPIDITEV